MWKQINATANRLLKRLGDLADWTFDRMGFIPQKTVRFWVLAAAPPLVLWLLLAWLTGWWIALGVLFVLVFIAWTFLLATRMIA